MNFRKIALCSAFAISALSLGGFSKSDNKTAEAETLYTITPVARYTFSDASNLGKDSIGTRDLMTYGSNLKSKSDEAQQNYLEFGEDSLLHATKDTNIGTMLGSYSIGFKVKYNVNPGEWAPFIALGNGYTVGVSLFGINGGFNAKHADKDCVYSALSVDGTGWNDVLMTFDQKEGIFKLFVDNILVGEQDNLVNFAPGNVDFAFSIGGRWNLWSNSLLEQTKSSGGIADVRVYNISFNSDNVSRYFNNEPITSPNRAIDWQGNFSNEQGRNGWFYAYGSPTRYRLLTWGYLNASYDIGWRVGHADWWQQVTKDSFSPGCFRWSTLRVWVADRDGVISIQGDIAKLVTDPKAMGDGVDAAIYMNGQPLLKHHFEKDESTPLEVNFLNVSVKKGDTVVFELHAGEKYNSANDYTAFRCDIFWEQKGDNYIEGEDLSKYLSVVETEGEIVGFITVPVKDIDFDKGE